MALHFALFYVSVASFFGVNSFNEIDARRDGLSGAYLLAALAALVWPLTLLTIAFHVRFGR